MQIVREYLKKLALRPLLVPAVLLFILINLFGDLLISDLEISKGPYNVYIISKTSAVSGDYTYYGRVEGVGKVRVYCDEDLCLGESIIAEGYLYEVDSPSNPGEFNFKDYLRRKGIRYVLNIDHIMSRKGGRIGDQLYGFRYLIRDKVADKLRQVLDVNDYSVMSALCLGDTSLISDDNRRAFNLSGCSHLLAVSGTHFSSFILIVSYACKGLSVRKKAIIQSAFILVIGFLTGWTESVTRAAFMSLCLLRGKDRLSGMSFSAIMMIMADPFCCRTLSFQMSFGAGLGMYFLSGPLERKTKSSLLAGSIASRIVMLPYYLINGLSLGFGSLAVQILSLFTVQMVCLFFVTGFILSFITPITLFPSVFFAKVTMILMDVGSEFYFSSVLFRFSKTEVSLLITGIIIVYLLKDHKLKILALASVITVMFSFHWLMDLSDQQVIFIDVGQGDSCLVISGGNTLLIDGGTYEEGSKVLPDVLDYYRIKCVDLSIATHSDEDHMGGLRYLEEQGRTARILTSYSETYSTVKCGDVINVGDIEFDVIWPIGKTYKGDNPESVVGILRLDGVIILMTGDIDEDSETIMTEKGLVCDCDILKVAHHGSKSSTGNEFLNCCQPEYAVISVAEHNMYGHPAPETMDRLGKVEAKPFLTSKNGAIIVKIHKNKYKIICFKG